MDPLFLLHLLLLLLPAVSSSGSCPTKCGDVEIPYPFGLGPNCSLPGFELFCNKTESGVEKPFYSNVEVLNISLPTAQVRMLNHVSSSCYNPENDTVTYSNWRMEMESTPYRFSDRQNKFTAVGCQTLAYIQSRQSDGSYRSGCVSMCGSERRITDGACSGIGCCQTSIPENLKHYEVYFDPNFNSSSTWNFSRCSYAVLLEEEWFRFQKAYATTSQFMEVNTDGRAPVIMDWAIGNETCEEARRNGPGSLACASDHSECLDSTNGPGYLCNCTEGYGGNPYVPNGCQDIDECDRSNTNCSEGAKCVNLVPGYRCYCPKGTHGEAYNGMCMKNQKLSLMTRMATGVCGGIIILLLCGLCLYITYQRRKLEEMKRKYFKEHGGYELKKKMKEEQGLRFEIFASTELEKATNNFDSECVIGKGGNGIVYKGVLEDKRIVAIKKPLVINEKLKKDFGTEALILSRIRHDNIVKLLGCCLETEVPILVYEFVPNGTLSNLIHGSGNSSPMSLDTRLRIAYESANALDYLHSKASPHIIHGDVKPSNILLDDYYIAKVSDFGASKLIPKGEKQFATLIQFTHGYIDPECLMTYELTYKSDVYSFGVVLLEIFTGKVAINFEESEEQRSLVSNFILSVNENKVFDILDNQVKKEADMELIQELGDLISRCLHMKGEERPTMKEVAEELDTLRKLRQHPQEVIYNVEENDSLLGIVGDEDLNTTSHIESALTEWTNMKSGR
ncbi:wall-associated receptor kinase 2-like [Curcuma longa]|uniref:wall-associated receptor kinase 2-like n=1 Tax=Curcuma longa TaxID=136217 RepID=UPI003D9E1E4D